MGELIYHPEAKAELREAAVYYESCREGLGRAYLRAVDAAVDRIIEFPEAWRRIHADFRRILVRRFPYGVIYALWGDGIYVVAIMHLKRKPGYWLTRVQDIDPTG